MYFHHSHLYHQEQNLYPKSFSVLQASNGHCSRRQIDHVTVVKLQVWEQLALLGTRSPGHLLSKKKKQTGTGSTPYPLLLPLSLPSALPASLGFSRAECQSQILVHDEFEPQPRVEVKLHLPSSCNLFPLPQLYTHLLSLHSFRDRDEERRVQRYCPNTK